MLAYYPLKLGMMSCKVRKFKVNESSPLRVFHWYTVHVNPLNYPSACWVFFQTRNNSRPTMN